MRMKEGKRVLRKIVKHSCLLTIIVCLVMANSFMVSATDSSVAPTSISPTPITETNANSADGHFRVKETSSWLNEEKDEGVLNIKIDTDELRTEAVVPQDILFIADESGSMKGDRIAKVKASLIDSVPRLLGSEFDNRLGLVGFSDKSSIISDFTTVPNDFYSAIYRLNAKGMTEYSAALKRALDMFNNRSDKSRKPVIVFMSDGEPTDSMGTIKSVANKLKAIGVEIYTIQYLNGAAINSYLKVMATDSNHAYNAPNLNSILDVYRTVVKKIVKEVSYKNIKLEIPLDGENFEVTSVSSDYGEARTSGNTIILNVPELTSGVNISINAIIKLKDQNKEGNLFVHKTSQLSFQASNKGTAETLSLDSTTLKRQYYTIDFDGNGNTNGELPDQIKTLGGSVTDIPENTGYLSKKDNIFSGWERSDTGENIEGQFVMPEDNITLKAIWGVPEIQMNTTTAGAVNKLKGVPLGTSVPNFSTMTEIEFVNYIDPSATIDLSENGDGSIRGWTVGTKLYIGSPESIYAPVNASSYFSNGGLTKIEFNGQFRTIFTTNMSKMFYGCGSLTSLDMSHFDTSKVTDMNGLFYGCRGFTSLDVSALNTSKVTNMSEMFSFCNQLTELNLMNFDTHNVTLMHNMFEGCNNLKSLNVSNFNTTKVISMGYMFNACWSMTSLNLSSFNTPNLESMGGMFRSCRALVTLDISRLDVSLDPSVSELFESDAALKTVYVKNQAAVNLFSSSFAMKPSGASLVIKPSTFSAQAVDEEEVSTFASTTPDTTGLVDGGRVYPASMVDYEIAVKYTATAECESGLMKVVNRIPEGLTIDPDTIVVMPPDRINPGDGGKTFGTIQNIEVKENVLTFLVNGLSEGAHIKLYYKAETPAVDTGYQEFLNNSTVSIEGITKTSNYVRHYMGVRLLPEHKLSYQYDGTQPSDAPDLPVDWNYVEGQKVSLANVGMPGYVFKGWTLDGTLITDTTFIMPTRDVTLIGSWVKLDEATKLYKNVSYEYRGEVPEGLNAPAQKSYVVGSSLDGIDTIVGKGITIKDTPTVPDGYVFTGWQSDELTTEDLTNKQFLLEDKDVTIYGTWEKITYDVTYEYLETPPVDAPELPAAQSYKWGTSVNTEGKLNDLEDATFDGWYTNNNIEADFDSQFTMPKEDVTFYAYWGEKPHTITYQYEGITPVDAPELGEDASFKDNIIMTWEAPISTETTDGKGTIGKWVFNGWTSEDVTIGADGSYQMPDQDITIKGSWTFEKNMNIRLVTFKVVNGTWSDNKIEDKAVIVELFNGKTTLNEADVPTGMKANDGYTDGHWLVEPNTAVDGITDSVTYTYTYVKKPKVTFKIENGSWADGSNSHKEVAVELTQGKGTLKLEDIPSGMKADEGYAEGYWAYEPDMSEGSVTKDIIYTYRFKKEAHVIFKISHGTWLDGSKEDKEVIVLLKDGYGTLSSETIPNGMISETGYGNGKWKEVPTTSINGITGDKIYEFEYTLLESHSTNDEKAVNTGDRSEWFIPIMGLIVSGMYLCWHKKRKTKL